MLPEEEEEGEDSQGKWKLPWMWKPAWVKSHDKSIKADPIHSLGSCLGEKGEQEYLKGQFRWEKEEKETQIPIAESLKGLAEVLSPGQRRSFWNGRHNKEWNTREKGNREMEYGRKIKRCSW